MKWSILKILMVTMGCVMDVGAESSRNNSPLPGRMNVGIHFGDQQAESFGDMFVPVMSFKSGLLFVNPRGTWNDDDGREFNMGLGYRQLIAGKDIILGANVFYDLRNTRLDNTFNQFGAGVEFLSEWVDVRMNVYLPQDGRKKADQYTVTDGTMQMHRDYWYAPTGQGHLITQYGYAATDTYETKTLQHYQIYEQAMEGLDGEIGALLPLPVIRDWVEVKAFVGYYDYNAHHGNDIAGMKGRLEIKPMPALYLDAAWFEDKELCGSRYSVGARASLPFDLANLSRGKNPFAGAWDGFRGGATKTAFASRMTEMVVRDLHIRTDASEPEEVVADRRLIQKTLIRTDRHDFNLVLASGVTFVDDDNRSGVEDGTWESPFRAINAGVQGAVGSLVYVCAASHAYSENVRLKDGLTLWGSGSPIYGEGGRVFGGMAPVITGGNESPAITLGNQVTVCGFEINQSANQEGISGFNVTEGVIRENVIHGNGSLAPGISLVGASIHNLSATISGNIISGGWGNGIEVDISGVSDGGFILEQNRVYGQYRNGILIVARGTGSGSFTARISGEYFRNGENGVSLRVADYETARVSFMDTVAAGNLRNGIVCDVQASRETVLSGWNLVAEDNLWSGMQIKAGLESGPANYTQVIFAGVSANRNGGTGLDLNVRAFSEAVVALSAIEANDNGENGLYGDLYSPHVYYGVMSEVEFRDYVNTHWLFGITPDQAGPIMAEGNGVSDIDVNW